MTRTLINSTIALSIALAPISFAQEMAPKVDRKMSEAKSTNFHRDSELRGLDLWTAVATEDNENVDLGDISDFVINPNTGEVEHIIISSGGIGSIGDTLRALTWDQIVWSDNADGERMAHVEMSEKAFRALPEFDVKTLTVVDETMKKGDKTIEASAKTANSMMAGQMPSQLCSDILEIEVFAPGEAESFTAPSNLVFDCDNGTVGYMTLEANDAVYLVPFDSFEIKPAPDQDDEDKMEYRIHAPHGPDALKSAPSIDKEREMTAQNPQFRNRVDAFYGKKSMKESMKDSTKKSTKKSMK